MFFVTMISNVIMFLLFVACAYVIYKIVSHFIANTSVTTSSDALNKAKKVIKKAFKEGKEATPERLEAIRNDIQYAMELYLKKKVEEYTNVITTMTKYKYEVSSALKSNLNTLHELNYKIANLKETYKKLTERGSEEEASKVLEEGISLQAQHDLYKEKVVPSYEETLKKYESREKEVRNNLELFRANFEKWRSDIADMFANAFVLNNVSDIDTSLNALVKSFKDTVSYRETEQQVREKIYGASENSMNSIKMELDVEEAKKRFLS